MSVSCCLLLVRLLSYSPVRFMGPIVRAICFLGVVEGFAKDGVELLLLLSGFFPIRFHPGCFLGGFPPCYGVSSRPSLSLSCAAINIFVALQSPWCARFGRGALAPRRHGCHGDRYRYRRAVTDDAWSDRKAKPARCLPFMRGNHLLRQRQYTSLPASDSDPQLACSTL